MPDPPEPKRIIAIGDVHGCSKALRALLEAIEPTQDDLIVPLGDYIDRGPDSRGVIDQLLELETQCQLAPLLGNHELMLLSTPRDELEYAAWYYHCGGDQTIASYGGDVSNIPPEHLDFIRRCYPFVETPQHIFLHANYFPDMTLEQQPEEVLFWTHLDTLTPAPHESGKQVIVGHTPQTDGEILDLGHVVCIDTCCFGAGWLTALDVLSQDVWQADADGQLRER